MRNDERELALHCVRLLRIAVLAAVGCAAAEPEKPACTAATHGRVWIERSVSGRPLRTEVCSLEVWRYRWTQVTVEASQLAKKTKPAKGKSGQR